MKSKIPIGSISDIALINPETTNSSWKGREIVYIDIGSVDCREFSDKPECMFYEDAPSRARRVVKHGDILISTVRPNRRSIIQILEPADYTVASTGFAVLRPKRIQDSDYLLALISNHQFTLELEMLAYGAAYPAVSSDDIGRIPVYLPSAKNRDQISNLLRPMHRIFHNDISVASANVISAIFRSWFIDFDPVISKDTGTMPFGLDIETTEIFPDSLADTEFGLIPEGWKWGTLSDLATLSKSSVTPKKFPEEKFDYYSIPAYDAGQISIATYGDDIQSSKFLLQEKCVLLSKLNPRINRVWCINEITERRSIASTEFLPWIPKDGISTYFLYSVMNSTPFRWLMEGLVTGTTASHQRVRPDDCKLIRCIIPPLEVIAKFNQVTEAIFSHINKSQKMKQEITKIYDILVPKLISGQLG